MTDNENLAVLLTDSAAAHPHRTAVITGARTITYEELDSHTDAVATLLRNKGVRKGQRVVLCCSNRAEFVEFYFGILKAGATVVAIDPRLHATEIDYQLNASRPALVVIERNAADPRLMFLEARADARFAWPPDPGSLRPAVPTTGDRELATVDADMPAVVLYTSGTTGKPKGAMLTHHNMRLNALASGELFGVHRDTPDRFLCSLPLSHVFGQTNLQNTAIAFGGTLHLQNRFDTDATLATIIDDGISFFAGVPTMYVRLLRAAGRNPVQNHLRVALSGGAPLNESIHRDFQAVFGTAILEGYGLSETSASAIYTRLGDHPAPGTVGRPVPGVEVKLLAPGTWVEAEESRAGEIAIKGYNVMAGYLDAVEQTERVLRDGWLRTGDLATVDDAGRFRIVGRAKEMIIRGGLNVYPREIEEVLGLHPAVDLVAAFGYPDDELGEEIAAYVTLADGTAVTSGELDEWCRDRLARYKRPRVIRIVTEMPTTSTGKISKQLLLAAFQHEHGNTDSTVKGATR
ncbi:class I adenylate-forming enzyme family protein [Mycolicibacterium sp.]|uniref:class I adenylate-forming enzyme family protein n=1 Tax=Mycolicibacterium sp. TaxID=2320850 RepID=UPI0037CAB0FD